MEWLSRAAYAGACACVLVTGCASSAPRTIARTPVSVSLAVPESAANAALDTSTSTSTSTSVEEILGRCTKASAKSMCSVTQDDAAAFCRELTPARAVKAFASGVKQSRMYLRGDVDAWSTLPGVHTSKTKAAFDEEVLVLAEIRQRGGIILNGSAATYEVMRWDGACATLDGGELTTKRPPAAKRPVDFARLDDETTSWLTADAALAKAESRRGKACASDRTDRLTAACVKASQKRDATLGRFVFGR